MAGDPKKVWELQLGRRLRESREAAKLSMRQVGEHTGHVRQLIHQWEVGTSVIQPFDIIKLAALYREDPSWLLTGKRSLHARPDTIVKASATQIRDFARIFDEARGSWRWGGTGDVVHPQTRGLSGRAFAFDALDRGMVPEIDIGDLVVIDTDVDPVVGAVALFVLRETGEILLRRSEWRGKSPVTLTATNPRIPPRAITKDDDPVCLGSLVESTHFVRHKHPAAETVSA
jgi:transcriptional regulator with XRE-family HTH domain